MSGFVEWKEPPRWLSTSETAALLGVTDRTVYRLVNDGKLPAFRVARAIRMRSTDVEAFLESVRIQPGELDHLIPEPYDGPRHIDLVEAG